MIKVLEKNYGFQEPKERLPEEYVFGSIQGSPVCEDGQWDEYLPTFEKQRDDNLETCNCTGFGSTNLIETYLKKAFGVSENYSDRGVGIQAGTYPPGNSPHTVLESIRKNGLIKEGNLPFYGKNVDEYYSPKPLPKYLLEEGLSWLEKWVFKHEWVDGDVDSMIEALKYSPLGVGVYAWALDDETFRYVRPKGKPDTHWCVVFGYSKGNFWKVFDSYDQSIKLLDWDFGFKWVKRIYIGKGVPKDKMPKLIEILNNIIEILKGAFNSIGRSLGSVTTNEIAFTLNSIIVSLTKIFLKKKEKEIIDYIPFEPENIFPTEKYHWDTKEKAKKAVIDICKEEGLNKEETKLICAVIECESNFNVMAINKNKDKKGNVTSVDYGIIQANSYWYVQKMKLITISEALYNPEKAVRLMIKRYKEGFLKDWVCYSGGNYKRFML